MINIKWLGLFGSSGVRAPSNGCVPNAKDQPSSAHARKLGRCGWQARTLCRGRQCTPPCCRDREIQLPEIRVSPDRPQSLSPSFIIMMCLVCLLPTLEVETLGFRVFFTRTQQCCCGVDYTSSTACGTCAVGWSTGVNPRHTFWMIILQINIHVRRRYRRGLFGATLQSDALCYERHFRPQVGGTQTRYAGRLGVARFEAPFNTRAPDHIPRRLIFLFKGVRTNGTPPPQPAPSLASMLLLNVVGAGEPKKSKNPLRQHPASGIVALLFQRFSIIHDGQPHG